MATFSAIRFVKNLNLAEWKTKFSPNHVESVTMSYMYTHGKCPDQHVHARSSIIHPLSFSKLLSLDVKDYNIAQRSWSDYANVHAYLGLICIWHNRFFFFLKSWLSFRHPWQERFTSTFTSVLELDPLGAIAQSVACLTADPEVASSILARPQNLCGGWFLNYFCGHSPHTTDSWEVVNYWRKYVNK